MNYFNVHGMFTIQQNASDPSNRPLKDAVVRNKIRSLDNVELQITVDRASKESCL